MELCEFKGIMSSLFRLGVGKIWLIKIRVYCIYECRLDFDSMHELFI